MTQPTLKEMAEEYANNRNGERFHNFYTTRRQAFLAGARAMGERCKGIADRNDRNGYLHGCACCKEIKAELAAMEGK